MDNIQIEQSFGSFYFLLSKFNEFEEFLTGQELIKAIDNHRVYLLGNQPINLSTFSDAVENMFPPRILGNAALISCAQFCETWGMDKNSSDAKSVRANFLRCIMSQVSSAFHSSVLDMYKRPNTVFKLRIEDDLSIEVFQNVIGNAEVFKFWQGIFPGNIAAYTWENLVRELEVMTPEESSEYIYTIKYRFGEYYDHPELLEPIVTETLGKSHSDIAQYIKRDLMYIDLAMRLANLTWFSTIVVNAYQKNELGTRLNPAVKTNLCDFDTMIKIKAIEGYEQNLGHTAIGQSEAGITRASKELAKDLWQYLEVWNLTEGREPPW